MRKLIAQIIVEILNFEMKMPRDHVWIRNQNKLIPNDTGLYIELGMINSSTISNSTRIEEQTDKEDKIHVHQIGELVQQEIIQVDIFSRANDILSRVQEVIQAMDSIYAQQQQEANNFKIFPNPRSFVDASTAEGGSMLNRYSITFATMVWYRKDTLLNSPLGDYYNDFRQRVDDEKTIGTDNPLIEFEINSEGIIP